MNHDKNDVSTTIETMKRKDAHFQREWDLYNKVEKLIDALVEERKRRNLTQRDLARLSGLKQEAIARMETMQAIPRLDTMMKLATAMNLEVTIQSAL